MQFNNLQKKWAKSFEQTIKSIENSITPSSQDDKELSQFKILSNWLITTDITPYAFLSEKEAQYLSNPFDTDKLLKKIHHALTDDGDISFVKTILKNNKNEEEIINVFMIFQHSKEDSFRENCLKINKHVIRNYIGSAQSSQRLHKFAIDKNLPLKSQPNKVPLIEDFIFLSHTKPLQFVQEVELLKLKTQLNLENHKKTMESHKSKNKL